MRQTYVVMKLLPITGVDSKFPNISLMLSEASNRFAFPNPQNDVSEKEQRWGAKTVEGSGHVESIKYVLIGKLKHLSF